jgi:hypothetical protein
MRRTLATLTIAAVAASVALVSPASGGPTVKDRCVQGEWRMSNAASNRLLQSLIPTGNIRVSEGVLTAAFPRRGKAVYGSTHFVVRISAGDMVLEGTATFHYEADWQTRAGKLVLGPGRSEIVISKFTAVKDGQTVTVPGPPPTIKRTAGGATPYTCTARTLRWKVPVNNTWAQFRRV